MLLLVNYRVFEVWCLTSMLHYVSVAALAFRLRPSSRCYLPLLSPFCSYFVLPLSHILTISMAKSNTTKEADAGLTASILMGRLTV